MFDFLTPGYNSRNVPLMNMPPVTMRGRPRPTPAPTPNPYPVGDEPTGDPMPEPTPIPGTARLHAFLSGKIPHYSHGGVARGPSVFINDVLRSSPVSAPTPAPTPVAVSAPPPLETVNLDTTPTSFPTSWYNNAPTGTVGPQSNIADFSLKSPPMMARYLSHGGVTSPLAGLTMKKRIGDIQPAMIDPDEVVFTPHQLDAIRVAKSARPKLRRDQIQAIQLAHRT
jgi:hypothetical protein